MIFSFYELKILMHPDYFLKLNQQIIFYSEDINLINMVLALSYCFCIFLFFKNVPKYY